MFEALIHRAANSVESVVARYAIRAAIAVPFILALGFGLAALITKLSERFGSVMAYTIVAAGFAVIGLLAAAAVAATEHGATNLTPADVGSKPAEATEATSEETPALPNSDVLLALLGTVGPKAIPAVPSIFRFLVRNWALVLSVAAVVFVLLQERKKSAPMPDAAE